MVEFKKERATLLLKKLLFAVDCGLLKIIVLKGLHFCLFLHFPNFFYFELNQMLYGHDSSCSWLAWFKF